MKVHIIYNFTDLPYGGANQFLVGLRNFFQSKGIYSEKAKAANVILYNSASSYSDIYMTKYKYPSKLYVHRVDGPCKLYNNLSDKRDDLTYYLNDRVADATIFQSEYVKGASIRMGCPRQKYEKVITNGCDTNIFYRRKESVKADELLRRKVKIVATSFSDNWKKGFRTYQWLDRYLDFGRYEMTFVGRTPCLFDNIRVISPQKSLDLAEILREQDVYITASENDPCSNSLIEAMACGLPVVALNSGGHPELVKEGGCLFENPREIPEMIEQIVNNYESYAGKVYGMSVEKVGEAYLDFFEQLLIEQQSDNVPCKTIGFFQLISGLMESKR